LVHSVRLKELAAAAAAASARDEPLAAVERWRAALELLPPGSSQHAHILKTIDGLSQALERRPAAAPPPAVPSGSHTRRGPILAALATAALLLLKFKFVLVFLFTKGKLLLLGLTKSSTLFSMLMFIGVYWTMFGWPLALGFALNLYVHEMGHVFALSRLGIAASAPMFIPGIGAVVRLKQYPASPREDARVGLAGPIWGLIAALVTWGLFFVTGAPVLAAIARVSAWVNLFNLLPVWQLDGSRGFRAMDRPGRMEAEGALLAMWVVTREGLLLLLVIAAIVRSAVGPFARHTDRRALLEYAGLTVALSLMTLIAVPTPAR
jgi:Zn-dependent protease